MSAASEKWTFRNPFKKTTCYHIKLKIFVDVTSGD
jgi:hypothetical protein